MGVEVIVQRDVGWREMQELFEFGRCDVLLEDCLDASPRWTK